MHIGAKTCDLFLNNGMRIYNFALALQASWSSILEAMTHLEGKEAQM
ncbi:hypothetical protein [Pantoea sp. SGAir0418]